MGVGRTPWGISDAKGASAVFFPITHEIWRWETPDPEDHWIMAGHLWLSGGKPILIDPPMQPPLPDALKILGGVQAVLLTTADHTRGARYLAEAFECPVYVPAQSVHAAALGLGSCAVAYDESTLLPGNIHAVRCHVSQPMWESANNPYLDEMMLVLPNGAVAVGDIAMGATDGRLWVCPEGFNRVVEPAKAQASLRAFAQALPRDSRHLLASHGRDIIHAIATELALRKAREDATM